MFKYLLIAALVACVAAVEITEVKEERSDVRADGFDIALSLSNGVSSSSSGDDKGNVVGVYEYETPEGVHVKVNYVANEYGYQPSSDLLPTPPPIPAEILKSLEYLKAHVKAN